MLNGLKNIERKCLAEAAKLFIGVWCNTDISFICKDRAGEYSLGPTPVFLYCMCFRHFLDYTISIVSHAWTPSYQFCSFLTIYRKSPPKSTGLIFFCKRFLMGLHKGACTWGGGGLIFGGLWYVWFS